MLDPTAGCRIQERIREQAEKVKNDYRPRREYVSLICNLCHLSGFPSPEMKYYLYPDGSVFCEECLTINVCALRK